MAILILCSLSRAGAREVIAMIESRKSVTKLILGHNDLGDEGCRELFRYLCSERGRRYRVEEISLNSNDIGDRGLDAIAEYLEDNKSLRELFLQNVRHNCLSQPIILDNTHRTHSWSDILRPTVYCKSLNIIYI